MGRRIKGEKTVNVNIHQSRCCSMVSIECAWKDLIYTDKIISQTSKLETFKTGDCKTLYILASMFGVLKEMLQQLLCGVNTST